MNMPNSYFETGGAVCCTSMVATIVEGIACPRSDRALPRRRNTLQRQVAHVLGSLSSSRLLLHADRVVLLPTARLETEILAKEGHHVILEAIGDRAGVGARIDLEGVRDSVL